MKKIIFILIGLELLLVGLYLSDKFYYKTPILTFLLDLDKEGSIGNFFSGGLLFTISSFLVLKDYPYLKTYPLKFLGLLFLFLGMDELIGIHENLGTYLSKFDWFPRFNQNFGEWIILYFFVGTGIFYLFFEKILFFSKERTKEFKIITTGIFLTLIGAMGFEILSYKINIRNEMMANYYRFEVAIEEFLEMLGLTIILSGVLMFEDKKKIINSNTHTKKSEVKNNTNDIHNNSEFFSTSRVKSFNKRSTFFIFQFWFFLILSFYYSPRLLSFIVIAPNWLSIVGIIVFTGIFNLFFYYIVFNILSIIFSNIYRNEYLEKVIIFEANENSKVAILYLTKDDFNEKACESCLNLDYKNYKVFILDDSQLIESKNLIDSFVIKYSEKIECIRRTDKVGFKAGNINHGLKIIGEQFEYFAITDSDGLLKNNFIKGLLKYFQLDSSIGFVQALCASNPSQANVFSKDMSSQVDIHWKHFIPYHNSYGFVMFYGHSALIKTSIVKEIGGFPEVVSEDLWFSFKLREKGYQGIFANDIITYEDVPEDYSRFRRRHEKWVRGTTEFLKKNWIDILKSKYISFFEKIDLLSSNFSMLMSASFILFILLIAFILPYYFKAFQLAGTSFNLPLASVGKQASDYLLGFRYNMYWSLDFFLVVAIGLLYPIIPSLVELWRQPLKFLNYIFISTGIYTSLTVSSALSVLSYLITGKTFFPVTGESVFLENKEKTGFLDFRSTSFKVQAVEILIGVSLIVVSFKSHNYWFLPIAISSLSVPLLIKIKNYIYIKWIVYIPFIIQIALLFLILKNIIFE